MQHDSDDFSNSVEFCLNRYSLILCSFQVPIGYIDPDQIVFKINNTSHGVILTWRTPNNNSDPSCYSTELQYKSQCFKDWKVLNTYRHLHIWAAVMLSVSTELRQLLAYAWYRMAVYKITCYLKQSWRSYSLLYICFYVESSEDWTWPRAWWCE